MSVSYICLTSKCGFGRNCSFGHNMEKSLYAEIAFNSTTKKWFGQLKNLSDGYHSWTRSQEVKKRRKLPPKTKHFESITKFWTPQVPCTLTSYNPWKELLHVLLCTSAKHMHQSKASSLISAHHATIYAPLSHRKNWVLPFIWILSYQYSILQKTTSAQPSFITPC